MKDVGRDERCSHVLPWWTPKDESLIIAHISQIITSTKKIISFKLWKFIFTWKTWKLPRNDPKFQTIEAGNR